MHRENQDRTLVVYSFAKINWHLRILGKRRDGYHELITVLETISLHDELTFNFRDDGKIILHCNDREIPTDDTNLIIRAAVSLQQRLRSPLGAEINLIKRIPTKAGLGGASSNAAVTLLALNALWSAKLENDELITIGGSLGADVPFFFYGGGGLATGTGTKVFALPDVTEQHLLVITPNASVATSNAYASLNAASLTTSESDSILSSSLADLRSADIRQWPLQNDFERVIFEIEPEIERAKMAMLEAGARGALLAGSGSSVFGVFDDEMARNCAVDNLKTEAGWKVFSCETVTRDNYFSSMNSSGFPLFTLS